MSTIARRSFLSTTLASMGLLALPTLYGGLRADQSQRSALEKYAMIWLEVLRVHFQIWHYRQHVLPLLLRCPTTNMGHRDPVFLEPRPADIDAFRHSADQLITALPTNGNGVSMEPLDHSKIVGPILDLQRAANKSTSCYWSFQANPGVPGYCQLGANSVRWDLRAMSPRLSEAILEACAEEITAFIESPEHAANPVDSVRCAGHDKLMRTFSTMPLKTFWKLIVPLFLIAPASPTALLTARRSDADLRFGAIIPAGARSYLYSTEMSMTCLFIMECFANNQFGRIREIALLPEASGNWHGFMAGAILDVLYQKVIVLRRLAAETVAM